MITESIRARLKELVYYKYLNARGSFRYFGQIAFFPKGSMAFKHILKNGIYEYDNLRYVTGNVKEGTVYLDIGANIGLMSLPILKQFKTTKVVSVEASPKTFGYLEATCREAGSPERWKLIHQPVGDVAGIEIDFYIASTENHAYESMRPTSRAPFLRTLKTTTTTIDEIWNGMGQQLVSFIKSDIEGADLLALKGGKECIASCRPVILVEWNAANILAFNIRGNELLEWCQNNGYACYAIPSMIRVESWLELKQHMLVTESFLLLPA
jgi:FkbM family methyltransferase